ncbi:ScyD/ScyE family protein [Microbacterium fluvii]|uniref:ScyD/ScyE family protein n=1 Tax=Microbacterium fluvii TaxID=415215 RepID=A0ABW2HBG9_9MICO|nr:ScyD/ScyE family protein [Microbacterium fluvii]MCU4672300.1 ScyD/ScyE family protein [Microbacterium fluvii]
MRIRRTLLTGAAAAALVISSLLAPAAASAAAPSGRHTAPTLSLLADGLQGTSGSTIGPDGALYVVEGAIGQVTRIDPRTGAATPFATGLPKAVIPIGGPIDIAFVDKTAYVLVANVGDDVPGAPSNEVDGIYRIDGPTSFTVIADIGDWSLRNPPPPEIDFFLTRGVPFALEPVTGGFLVTDGHHNRVLKVSMSGRIRALVQFENTVPTGLAARGRLVFMAEAGPVPHDPSTGTVLVFGLTKPRPVEVASGYSLLTDVEFGPCGLYAVSQGDSPGDVPPGSPALPDSGELLLVGTRGRLSVVADELDLPVSVSFRGGTAYVVTVNGEVWTVSGLMHKGCTGR